MVEVAVLAKNMTKERVDIHIDQQHLRVVIRDAEGQQEYELNVELYGQVSYINVLSPSPVGSLPSPPLRPPWFCNQDVFCSQIYASTIECSILLV